MIKTVLFDFSHVVLLPNDRNCKGGLNELYKEKSKLAGFRFEDYFKLNTQLLNFLDTIKEKYELCVFTYGTIQEAAEVASTINKLFSRIFSEAYTGYSKENPQSYLDIAKELGKKPQEILFTDDKPKNVLAAKQAGLITIHFRSTKQFIAQFQEMVKL